MIFRSKRSRRIMQAAAAAAVMIAGGYILADGFHWTTPAHAFASCGADPFQPPCCPEPCPVNDSGANGEENKVQNNTSKAVDKEGDVGKELDKLKSEIGDGTQPAAMATATSTAVSNAAGAYLQNQTAQGLAQRLLATGTITGGYLPPDSIATLDAAAKAYIDGTTTTDLAAIAKQAVGSSLAGYLGSGNPVTIQNANIILSNAAQVVSGALVPSLAQNLATAARTAIAFNAFGPPYGAAGPIAPAAIAQSIAASTVARVLSNLNAFALTDLPSQIAGGGPYAAFGYSPLPTAAAAPVTQNRAAVTGAIAIPNLARTETMPSKLAAVALDQPDAILDGLALAWHVRSSYRAMQQQTAALAAQAESAQTVDQAIRAQIAAQAALMRAYGTLQAIVTETVRVRADTFAAKGLKQGPVPTTEIAPRIAGAGTSTAPDLTSIVSLIASSLGLHNALNTVNGLATLKPGFDNTIATYNGSVVALGGLTTQSVGLLALLYQDPEQAFAKITSDMLAADTVPWWQSPAHVTAEANAANAAVAAIAADPTRYGTPIPGAFTPSDDPTLCGPLCQFQQQAPSTFQSWLDTSAYERYYATLADRAQIDQLNIANESTILAYRNDVPVLTSSTVAPAIANNIASIGDTTNLPAPLQTTIDALTSDPNAATFIPGGP